MNTRPTHTTAVFRSDTFGQFRDMLEQRPFTRMYMDQIEEDTVVSEKVLDADCLTVQVSFRSRTDAAEIVKPAATNSQNLSSFATSSMPYFDDATKSRFDIQPDMSASFINE